MQGYLSTNPEATVRVRIKGDSGYLTVKGITTGCTRNEWEYEIDPHEAREMLSICKGPMIHKRRWLVDFEGYTWEVDEFFGRLEGLIIAEIEIHSEDDCPARPPFLGEEVTEDPRYYNSNLIFQPCAPCSSR